MENIFVSLPQTLAIGSLAYFFFFGMLRLSGKRTLSQWNAFDFVVTVAFGSILATTVMPQPTTLKQGAIGLGLLVSWQVILAWLSVQVPAFQRIVKGTPRLLLWQGEFQKAALQAERVTSADIRAAIRSKGIAEIEQVGAVVLETDGTFTVMPTVGTGAARIPNLDELRRSAVAGSLSARDRRKSDSSARPRDNPPKACRARVIPRFRAAFADPGSVSWGHPTGTRFTAFAQIEALDSSSLTRRSVARGCSQ
jgi:uncharacterized membrane protein YcaP (DUF421 family)